METLYTIRKAQLVMAALYRRYERRAPWNSKTRAEWRSMRRACVRTAMHYGRA